MLGGRSAGIERKRKTSIYRMKMSFKRDKSFATAVPT